MTQKIAVIGAGMAGLTVGKILSKKGFLLIFLIKGVGLVVGCLAEEQNGVI